MFVSSAPASDSKSRSFRFVPVVFIEDTDPVGDTAPKRSSLDAYEGACLVTLGALTPGRTLERDGARMLDPIAGRLDSRSERVGRLYARVPVSKRIG